MNANSIVGTWLNHEKNAHIEIYEENGKYFGKISKVFTDKLDTSKMDGKGQNLSEEEKKSKMTERSQKMINTIILRDLKFSKNEWKDGTLLIPQKDESLKSSVKLVEDNNSLAIKVKKGWFSKTIYWTKVNQ
jgi:uncharacterized protein (DUF2147 family)